MDPRTLLIVTLLAAAASGQSFRDLFRDIFGSLSRPGNSTSGGGTRTSFWYPEFTSLFGQRQFSVRLVGGSNSREGNVEVLIYGSRGVVGGWRSVCDIGWTQAHAEAVCRQLGFPGTAVATRNGRFGFRSTGTGTMVSNCQVGAGGRGLRDCFYRGLGTTEGSCRSNNIAGVICGTDPSSPYGGRMDVRLRGGGTRGDVEVRYGGRGWGPVCGDGFDLKDATVVCRQLSLGAAKRSYISGRRASGAFILAGVECSGRETSLAQCRSVRGASVRCAGNQFSGAAVECAGQQSRDLPDLRVDAQELQDSAILTTETLGDLECALDENCLAKTAAEIKRREPTLWRTRTRKLFRFTNKVWNNGKADYRPRADPSQWEWHACHEHYHSEESFSEYDLTYEGTDTKAAQGHKASFCLEDSECRRGITQKYQCYIERGTRPPQGIRAGCADIYGSYIDCQWIDVTDIRSGKYVLRVRINADRKVPEVSFDDNQVICSVDLNLEDETVRVTNCRNAPL
ncbi:lysyl oxidase homolog 3A-like [Amphibalanus amphitrite]|uniref:lysyl oxidase homolog 3A-like n=1 Tax=Amphibalanus amphitrite TaxID=1232801 RepID=UPI001C90656B|nr:lysyl oxidase homolog 3A-like [Amphibalanus amphitrite]